MSSPESEEEIIRYLLDDLGKEERERLEERLFREPSFFETVSSVEDDLIMEYVRGKMEERRLSRFTAVYFGSEAKRARVESAQALQQAVRDTFRKQSEAVPQKQRFWLSLAGTAAVIFLAAVLLRYVNSPSSKPLNAPNASEITLSLAPDQFRSGGGVSIRIPVNTRVRFRLAISNVTAHASYRAVVGTPEHANIWNGMAEVKETELVTVVPAGVLNAGDYSLQLQTTRDAVEWQNVATYYFRVER